MNPQRDKIVIIFSNVPALGSSSQLLLGDPDYAKYEEPESGNAGKVLPALLGLDWKIASITGGGASGANGVFCAIGTPPQ